MRQNGLDARKRQGLGNINLANLRVSMSAAEYTSIKHPGKMDVAGISSFSRCTLYGINARGWMTDRLSRGECRRQTHREPPAGGLETVVRRLLDAETFALVLADEAERLELRFEVV